MKKCLALACVTLIVVVSLAGQLPAQEAVPGYLPPEDITRLEELLKKYEQEGVLSVAEATELVGFAREFATKLGRGSYGKKEAEIVQNQLERMKPYAAPAALEDRLAQQKELAAKLQQDSTLTSEEHVRLQQLSNWLAEALANPLFQVEATRIRVKLETYGDDAFEAIKTHVLGHADLNVRLQGALALSHIANDAALQQLLEMLKNDNEKEALRIIAINACGEKKYSPAGEALVMVLSHPQAALRGASARALGQVADTNDQGALAALVELLQAENERRKETLADVEKANADVENFKKNILGEVADPDVEFDQVELFPDEKVDFEKLENEQKALLKKLADQNLVILRAADAINVLTEGKQGKEVIEARDGKTLEDAITEVKKWWEEQKSATASSG